MSAPFRGPAVADWGPRSIRVYTAEDRPRLIAVIRALDHGDVDQLLRAYGWRRLGAWMRSDDMPADHRVVTVERIADLAIDRLDRDQEHGAQERASMRQDPHTEG